MVRFRRIVLQSAMSILTGILLAVVWTPALVAHEGEPRRIIIDSDPGMGYLFRDIDDGLMLIAALGSPELEIVGITTTFGNVSLSRATVRAREIVSVLGRDDIPVIAGAASADHRVEENSAARFIVDTIRSNPGEIAILATGPLTNIAAAIEMDPSIVGSIAEIIAVGGLIESDRTNLLKMPYDLNFGRDPGAAESVLGSGANLTLIHIELCLEFATAGREFGGLLESTGELGGYLRAKTRSWRLIKAGNFVLWDVVALNYLQHPDWYETRQTGIRVSVMPGPQPSVTLRIDEEALPRIRVPMAMADLDLHWHWLGERLAQAGRSVSARQ